MLNILILGVAILLIAKTDKINIFIILKGHFNTLKYVNAKKEEKFYKRDLITLYIFPIIVGFNLTFLNKMFLTDDIINIIITAFSIFIGFLINALLLVFSLKEHINDKHEEKMKLEILKRITKVYNNLMFTILLSVIIVTLSIVWSFLDLNLNNQENLIKISI